MANTSKKLVSLIVPCYNEEDMIAPFLERARTVFASLPSHDFEFLFVDDGSLDQTYGRIAEEAERGPQVKLVSLSRNFGHQRAISAGLDFCTGDYIIVIDADLQDPPELIPRIVEQLDAGFDIVHMVRTNRAVDGFAKRFSAKVFYSVMRRFALPRLPENAPDFKGFSRRALEALQQYDEHVRFLRGMMATLGFRQTSLTYTREARFAGKSKYPWKKVLAFGRDATVSFSVIPLRLGFLAGGLTCAFACILLVLMACWQMFGPGLQTPLSAFLLTILIGIGGIILVVLGILGEYIGTLMREVKGRPLYIVDSVKNLPPKGQTKRQD